MVLGLGSRYTQIEGSRVEGPREQLWFYQVIARKADAKNLALPDPKYSIPWESYSILV